MQHAYLNGAEDNEDESANMKNHAHVRIFTIVIPEDFFDDEDSDGRTRAQSHMYSAHGEGLPAIHLMA